MLIKLIKEERVRQGLSLRELARKAGVSDSAIHNWEKGRNKLTVENADKILKALGLTISIGKESDLHKK